MRIPAKYANILFGGMLSAIMVTVISGTVLFVNQGYTPDTGFLPAVAQGVRHGLADRVSHRFGGRAACAEDGGAID